MSEEAKEAVQSAIDDSSKWVLKLQREGGGNNLYGKELSEFLKSNSSDIGGQSVPVSLKDIITHYMGNTKQGLVTFI